MVDVLLVMVLLMAGLTLAEADPDTKAAPVPQSETPVIDPSSLRGAVPGPCVAPSPHFRDLSSLERAANAEGSQGKCAPDEM